MSTAPAVSAAPGPPRRQVPLDPILLLLVDPDYDARRPALKEALGAAGDPCRLLPAYARNPSEAVREHAVRALDDAGCDHLDAYRPFFRDRAAWVIESVVRALRTHLISEGVPFLLDHLADRRRILSDEGSWSLGESAHRALRTITCRSFHYEPGDRPEARALAISRFRSWYEEHHDEPRGAWVVSGIALARSYLDADQAKIRREGFDLLGAIGAPAAAALRAALVRSPEDLRVAVACLPDEPPRVSEEIPCALEVQNISRHRVALAIGSLVVKTERQNPASRSDEPEGRRKPASPAKGGRSVPGATSSANGGAPKPAELPGTESAEDLARAILDLAPGEILKREFKVGPVFTSGRYDVRALLPDLSAPARGQEARTRPPLEEQATMIEGRTVVRFEQ